MSDFVYHASFQGKHAERRIMRDPAPIPRANTSWYFAEQDGHTAGKQANVLTPDQEKVLFIQYNYARWRARTGSRRWAAVAEEKKNMLAEYNLALVLAMVARQVGAHSPHYQDIVAECNLRLIRAIELFDVSKGYKFSTYACHAIVNQSGRTAQRTHDREMQELPSTWAPSSDPLAERREEEETDMRADRAATVQMALQRAGLTAQERRILDARYLGEEKMILEALGREFGISKERVRQIQTVALDKVRRALDEINSARYAILEGDFVHDRHQEEAADEDLHEVREAASDQPVRRRCQPQ